MKALKSLPYFLLACWLCGCQSVLHHPQAPGTVELHLDKGEAPIWLTDVRLYIDGDFIGTHGPEDKQPKFSLSPGWHTITAEGLTYEFREQEPYPVVAEERIKVLGEGTMQPLKMPLKRKP